MRILLYREAKKLAEEAHGCADLAVREFSLIPRAIFAPGSLSAAEARTMCKMLHRAGSRWCEIADALEEERLPPEGIYDRAAADMQRLLRIPEERAESESELLRLGRKVSALCVMALCFTMGI